MTTADAIRKQKQEADQLKRLADKAKNEQQTLLRRQIADLDKQIVDLQRLRNDANTELSKLG